MKNIYYHKKMMFKPHEVKFIYIFFDNGDYISLDSGEIVDFSFDYYDKLIWFDKTASPVAKKGFIKLNINKLDTCFFENNYIGAYKEYKDNRKEYIENKCIGDNGITCIRLFNNDNWSMSIYGHFNGELENGFLLLSAIDDYPSRDYQSDEFNIELNPIDKSSISKITLDFENCENFEVFAEEIVDMQLVCNNQLTYGSNDYSRELSYGYIKVKFKSNFPERYINLFSRKKEYKPRDLRKRLCGKDGKDYHNICHLYIEYKYAGFGKLRVESIDIKNSIYSKQDVLYSYISGYCEELEDRSVIIYFHKDFK